MIVLIKQIKLIEKMNDASPIPLHSLKQAISHEWWQYIASKGYIKKINEIKNCYIFLTDILHNM